ncbi:MAG TPA: hypothetical protein DCE42_17970 [Myxococcales bacterium]|nr:hypothetical protein [Deltaproteobacteria bacterium]HAA56657.1 hypothetical protein [Myxococcales bacterium]|tara:strand:- start:501 stop:1190 length:690 start_codon:yes stop_codon:yes gene_type:complete
MGIWQRFKRMVRSNTNAALNKLEDPRRELMLLEEDLAQEKQKARQATMDAIVEQKRLEKTLQKEQKQAEEWEDKARRALELSDEDLAKEALRHKTRYDARVAELELEVVEQRAAIEALKRSEQMLAEKARQALKERDLLLARMDQVEINQQAQASTNMDDQSPLAEFERIKRDIETTEASVVVNESLHTGLKEADFDRRLKDLEHSHTPDDDFDDALAKLKAKMGKAEQ